jgi:hypothetical protein
LRGNAAESSQEPGYRRADSGLRVGAIKTECRRDTSDHIGRQELHNERDEIDGHRASSSLSLDWEQTFPYGMRVSRRRKASDDVALDHFLKQRQISDEARMRYVLKNLRDSCQGFHRADFRFFPHRLSRKPLIFASGWRVRCHRVPPRYRVFDRKADRARWLAGDDHGRSDARTNARRQLFDPAHSTLPPARLRLGMPATTWVFAENASVIGPTTSILLRVSSSRRLVCEGSFGADIYELPMPANQDDDA